MSYIGGKARGSQHILAVLNHPQFDGYDYVEPALWAWGTCCAA